MLDTGHIKIHRKLRKSWVFSDPQYLKAWLVILMEVNFAQTSETISGYEVQIDRGQQVHSLPVWAGLFGRDWDRHKVRRFFDKLEECNMIKITPQASRRPMFLTVVNYDQYQSVPPRQGSHQETRQETRQQGDLFPTGYENESANDCAKDRASNRARNKNSKEVINNPHTPFGGEAGGKKPVEKPSRRKPFIKPTVEEVDKYCKSRNNGITGQEFVNHYDTCGWVVGKDKPMVDWQAAVRTWEDKRKKNNKPQQTPAQPSSWGRVGPHETKDVNGEGFL